MRIPEHVRADRVDHRIVNRSTEALLHGRIERRVLPEIAKSFQYPITHWERLRIGCCQGERGGALHGHRDNIEPTPYRRFAMSINLNVEKIRRWRAALPRIWRSALPSRERHGHRILLVTAPRGAPRHLRASPRLAGLPVR
jgi:hypothetical protein